MTVPRFNEYLGVHVARMRDGEAEAWLDLAPHHLNGRGVAHGGVIASILDTALGASVIAAIPPEWWCATISLTVQFLEGAHAGRVTASARVVRRGRRVAFAAGELRDVGGRLLATAQGSWHLWPQRPGAPDANRPDPHVVVRGTGERIRVGKILAVGRNYAEHGREMGYAADAPPVLFLKPATANVHDGASIALPEGLGQVHHEVELVVVIGEGGRAIPADDALGGTYDLERSLKVAGGGGNAGQFLGIRPHQGERRGCVAINDLRQDDLATGFDLARLAWMSACISAALAGVCIRACTSCQVRW